MQAVETPKDVIDVTEGVKITTPNYFLYEQSQGKENATPAHV